MSFTEFDKKYNTRKAACCRNCESFTFEEEIELTALGSEAGVEPKKRKVLFGECKVAKEMGNSVTKTTSDTICDAHKLVVKEVQNGER